MLTIFFKSDKKNIYRGLHSLEYPVRLMFDANSNAIQDVKALNVSSDHFCPKAVKYIN